MADKNTGDFTQINEGQSAGFRAIGFDSGKTADQALPVDQFPVSTAQAAAIALKGDALTSNPLSQFSATTLAQLNATLSNAALLSESTGLLTGGLITVAGTTTIAIADGTGQTVNNYDAPGAPTGLTPVSWNGLTAVTITGVATNGYTYIAIDSAGAVVQQTSGPFFANLRRTLIGIGSVLHIDGAIVDVTPEAGIVHTGTLAAMDFARISGLENTDLTGNVFTKSVAAPATLQVRKTGGGVAAWGIEPNDPISPHTKFVAAADPLTFNYTFRDGAGDFNYVDGLTVADPNFYDTDTGSLVAVPAGRFTTQLIWMYPSGLTVFQYGQKFYNKMSIALADLVNIEIDANPHLVAGALLRGFCTMQEGVTDFDDPDTAIFSVATAGGAITIGDTSAFDEVLDDTSPQLGGDLDGNGFQITNTTIFSFSNLVNADALVVEVRNTSGVTITKGAAVFVNGYNAGQDKPTIALAGNDDSSTLPCAGLVTQDILNNANGPLMVAGRLTGLDTSAFSDAEVLYLSDTAGDLQNTKPTDADESIQAIGGVLRSHATLGVIEVVTGEVVDSPNIHLDDRFRIADQGDETKIVQFQVSGVTTGTTRTLTVPDKDGTISLLPDENEVMACSDETTAISTGIKAEWTTPDYAITLTGIEAFLSVAASSTTLIVDASIDTTPYGGGFATLMSSDKIEIEAGEFHTNEATDPPALTTTAIPARTKIQVEVDQAGGNAAGLKVRWTFTRD